MSRQEDFTKASAQFDGIYAQVAFSTGCEHGYHYAKDKIEKLLLCIELSNFFPTIDEDEEIAKGREKLIEFISKTMEEL